MIDLYFIMQLNWPITVDRIICVQILFSNARGIPDFNFRKVVYANCHVHRAKPVSKLIHYCIPRGFKTRRDKEQREQHELGVLI